MPRQCSRCAAWEARYDKLADQFAQLALQKATTPTRSGPVARPAPPETETALIRSAEAEALLELEAPIFAQTNGLTLDQAKAELRRLRGIATATHVDPPILSPL